MRAHRIGGLLAAMTLLLSGGTSEVRADPPVSTLTTVSVDCLITTTSLVCGDGYRAVLAENDSANCVRFGGTGITTTLGHKRCTSGAGGVAFSVDANMGQAKCISTTGSTVTIVVTCGK